VLHQREGQGLFVHPTIDGQNDSNRVYSRGCCTPKSRLIRPGFKRACSLATRSGRITLSDQRLITTHDGERTEHALTDRDYQTVLTEHCGIVLSPGASWLHPFAYRWRSYRAEIEQMKSGCNPVQPRKKSTSTGERASGATSWVCPSSV
jgi:hypothetical protein